MKNKLETKHLSMYIPFGLKGHLMGEHAGGDNIPRVFTMMGIETFKELKSEPFVICEDDEYHHEVEPAEFFPVMRPLSDLTEEIEHNGIRFIPAYALFETFTGNKLQLEKSFTVKENYITVSTGRNFGTNSSTIETCIINTKPERMQLWQLEKMLEWHFDLFGLIEKKLAVKKTNN